MKTISPSVVVGFGKARNTRYACLRDIGDHGNQWVLFDATSVQIGEPKGFGTFFSIWPQGLVFKPSGVPLNDTSIVVPEWMLEGVELGVFPDIPWFLDELIPQGFLGRNFVRSRPELKLGPDPAVWGFAERLLAMLEYGTDVPGSYLLGLQAILDANSGAENAEEEAVTDKERLATYEARSRESLAGETAGSSAGGEQPKFTAVRTHEFPDCFRVIVKFSGALSEPVGRRWADLLWAESKALAILERHGVEAVVPEIVEGGTRLYLESRRFDRFDEWGRKAMISLRPLVAAFDGGLDETWADVAPRLLEQGWISERAADAMIRAHWFGRLIGNADMHFGNVSVFLSDARPFELCPIYDMLPMQYRPSTTGDLIDHPLVERPLRPKPQEVSVWQEVAVWAIEFWDELAEDEKISPAFRELADANRDVLQSVDAQVVRP